MRYFFFFLLCSLLSMPCSALYTMYVSVHVQLYLSFRYSSKCIDELELGFKVWCLVHKPTTLLNHGGHSLQDGKRQTCTVHCSWSHHSNVSVTVLSCPRFLVSKRMCSLSRSHSCMSKHICTIAFSTRPVDGASVACQKSCIDNSTHIHMYIVQTICTCTCTLHICENYYTVASTLQYNKLTLRPTCIHLHVFWPNHALWSRLSRQAKITKRMYTTQWS